LFVALVSLSFASCPLPGEDAYAVTVNQSEGGTIDADPVSGPAGTLVTLTNSADENYTFSHYLVDGQRNDKGSFTLEKDTTVSGVFTHNGTGPYTVTVSQPKRQKKVTVTIFGGSGLGDQPTLPIAGEGHEDGA
jgi:hypothetical protein